MSEGLFSGGGVVEVSELMSNQRRIVERCFEKHDGGHVATTTVIEILIDLYIFPLPPPHKI
jgi:hypothetical protein